MSVLSQRRNCLPVIYVRGTHYDVGYDIGRTFAYMIQNYVQISPELDETLPHYLTPEGRKIYDATLETCKNVYPQYVQELQGLADGANVPFFKLFLIHMGDILPISIKGNCNNEGQGCSTMCMNQPSGKFIAHTEDALKEVLNHTYIVKATITESEPHEVFTAYCYAGLLPGYAMGFNKHFAFSVNILGAKYPTPGGLPRTFVTRALFTANSIDKVKEIVKCTGTGCGDAMSLNLIFFGNSNEDSLMYNLEMGPSYPSAPEAAVSVVSIGAGENLFHCNKFLRLRIPEVDGLLVHSSNSRHHTKEKLPDPKNVSQLLNVMGDDSCPTYNIFRNDNGERVRTISVGLFNVAERTWTLYMDNPRTSEPIVVLPLGNLTHN